MTGHAWRRHGLVFVGFHPAQKVISPHGLGLHDESLTELAPSFMWRGPSYRFLYMGHNRSLLRRNIRLQDFCPIVHVDPYAVLPPFEMWVVPFGTVNFSLALDSTSFSVGRSF